jgi:hypothetical protein
MRRAMVAHSAAVLHWSGLGCRLKLGPLFDRISTRISSPARQATPPL